MVKMKFKDFEFPNNPLFIKTELAQRIKENPVLSGKSNVYHLSERAAVKINLS